MRIFVAFLFLAAFPALGQPARAGAMPVPEAQLLRHFTDLSDIAAKAMMYDPPDRENHKKVPGLRDYHMFFVDSYAVRALAVAYDLTGRERYWEACRAWTERMIAHQKKMIPAGAYYMNYNRKPGETNGQWFVADAGSIAMAVLATAARAKDPALRERYYDSVRDYLNLVLDHFVPASGGVTDGYYDKWTKEWWCSTALYAGAALQYHGLRGDPRHLKAGLRAVDWLLGFQYSDTTEILKFEDGAPTTIFYVLEAYSSALPYLDAGTDRQRKVFEKFSQTMEWIAYHQTREGTWTYNPDNWGVKLGGFPCHMLIYERLVRDGAARRRQCVAPSGKNVTFEQLVADSAALALTHFASLPLNPEKFTQKDAFVLLSEAERLCPGELYQKRKTTFPYRRITERQSGAE